MTPRFNLLRHYTRTHLDELFGFFTGLALMLPLAGRFGGVSCRFGGIAFLCIALFIAFAQRHTLKMPSKRAYGIIGIILAYGLLVIAAGTPAQFELIFHSTEFLSHPHPYHIMKLAMFLAGFFPPFVLLVVFSLFAQTAKVKLGLIFSFIFMASLVGIRILSDSALLAATDYATAAPFYTGEQRGDYSLIGASLLLGMGVLAAFSFIDRSRKKLIVCSLFIGASLFLAFWINRRADTIFCIFLLLSYALLSGFRHPERRRPIFTGVILSLLIMLTLASTLYNGVNAAYWENAGKRTLLHRADYVEIGLSPNLHAGVADNSLLSFLTRPGGLASFSERKPQAKYPHNILIETFYEIGWPATFILILLMGTTTIVGCYGILRGSFQKEQEVLWLIAGFIMLNTMFAGDITGPRSLFFFMGVSLIGITKRPA